MKDIAANFVPPIVEVPVWMTVRAGVYKTLDNYRKALKVSGVEIHEQWNGVGILDNIDCSQEVVDYDLFIVFPENLNFGVDICPAYEVICETAKQQGFEICPAEIALLVALWWEENDGLSGEFPWVMVTAEVVYTNDFKNYMFEISHLGCKRTLSGSNGAPNRAFGVGEALVFSRRR